jgi:hypothetical protein
VEERAGSQFPLAARVLRQPASASVAIGRNAAALLVQVPAELTFCGRAGGPESSACSSKLTILTRLLTDIAQDRVGGIIGGEVSAALQFSSADGMDCVYAIVVNKQIGGVVILCCMQVCYSGCSPTYYCSITTATPRITTLPLYSTYSTHY